MPQFCSKFDVISKKKGLQGKMPPFFQDFEVISKRKKKRKGLSVFHMLISQCSLDGPSEAHGPPEANRPHDGAPSWAPGHFPP